MPARIHPGEVILSMDHSVITFRDGGRPDGVETGFISVYDVAYSTEVGAGRVALLRLPAAGVDALLADSADIAARMIARLRRIGMSGPALDGSPVILHSVEREPFHGHGFGYRLRADGLDVHARWDDCEPPFFAEGPAPAFSKHEDIWSVFVAARRASLVVNGVAAGGAPYEDDGWVPRLPRPLSSAHAALAETRLRPHPGRVPA